MEISMWRPLGTVRSQLRAFFVGASPELHGILLSFPSFPSFSPTPFSSSFISLFQPDLDILSQNTRNPPNCKTTTNNRRTKMTLLTRMQI